MAGLFTSTTPTLFGGTSVTEAHISTICDSIILLRYVETPGKTRRGRRRELITAREGCASVRR